MKKTNGMYGNVTSLPCTLTTLSVLGMHVCVFSSSSNTSTFVSSCRFNLKVDSSVDSGADVGSHLFAQLTLLGKLQSLIDAPAAAN